MFSFTGSAIVSIDSTVTGRSRSPLSATTNAVSNFSVLAGARIWSGFFSYKTSPLWALITMTELAPVEGAAPGTVGVVFGSSGSLGLTVARCLRLVLCWCGTPVGVTALISSSPGGGVAAKQHSAIAHSAIQALKRRVIGGEISGKNLSRKQATGRR